MRNFLAKRIFMIEEGASPGGGAVTPPPAESPAQTAASAPAPGITLDQVKGLLGEFKTEIRNGVLADLRKAGELKQVKAAAAESTASPTTAATPGMTAADVKNMLERERVITTRAVKFGLTDAQTARMRSALDAVQSGDSIAAEADAYLNDMGLAKAPTQTAPLAVTPTPPEPAKPAPAAPAAPAKVDSVTNAGLVDLFNIPPEHFARMSPDDLRREFEKIAAVGRQNSGAPSRPKAPTR